MLDYLSVLLLPFIFPMELLFNTFWGVFGSAGFSIVLLALVMSVLMIPLKRWAKRIEDEYLERKQIIDGEIEVEASGLKGEQRFEVIEIVYERHGFHPIRSVVTGASFFVSLPFLISAIYVFSGSTTLTDVRFLFFPDLSDQDRLLFEYNLLPIAMLSFGIIDASFRFSHMRTQLFRYIFISVILFFLVYTLPSALIIYWISMNIFSSVVFFFYK